MERRGIKGSSALARAVGGGVHPSTAKMWMDGRSVPYGDNQLRLTSVLGVSAAWLFGARHVDARTALVRALREELGEGLDCPEADIVDAMGGLTFEQRRLLRDSLTAGLNVAGAIAKVGDVAPIGPAPAATPGVRDQPVEIKPKSRRKHG